LPSAPPNTEEQLSHLQDSCLASPSQKYILQYESTSAEEGISRGIGLAEKEDEIDGIFD